MATTQVPSESLLRSVQRRVLTTLCLTQVTGWGVLYYAFPVLAPGISASTGWSLPLVMGAFSTGQLVSALVGIPVGRWLDRWGPRWIMSAGSMLAIPALVAIATAQTPVGFFAGWILAGVAMGGVLYPPAFAALTRWYGPRRVGALTVLTLAAGLASTVFAPLTAYLQTRGDWRQTYLLLALILAVVTIPAHIWGLRGHWPETSGAHTAHETRGPSAAARSRPFLALGVALALTAFAAFAAVINLVPLMAERGISTETAALAMGLGGAGQVLGRLGYGPLSRHTSVQSRTTFVLLATAATTALLALLSSAAMLIVAAVLAGMVRGMLTLLQATAVTDRWGPEHYGWLTGLLSAPLTATMALAPFAGAVLAGILGGYAHTYLVLAALATVAAIVALACTPDTGRNPVDRSAEVET